MVKKYDVNSGSLEADPPAINSDDSIWNFKNGVSRGFLTFVIRALISLIIVVFCVIMIATNPTANNTLYFTIMTSTAGSWMPSPFSNK